MKILLILISLCAAGCASVGTAYSTGGFSVAPVDNTIHIPISCAQAQQFLRGGGEVGMMMFPADCGE